MNIFGSVTDFWNQKPIRIAVAAAVVVWSVGVGVLWPSSEVIHASTAGPTNAGAGADNSGVGTATWANTGGIVSSNDVTAFTSLSVSAVSHYIVASNFGFAIPANATIDGITLSVEQTADVIAGKSQIRDNAIRLVKGGTIQTTDKSTTANWGNFGADIIATYGGSADLWAGTWTPSDINASTFGAAISAKNVKITNPGETLATHIDNVQITVTYSIPTYNQSNYRIFANANSTTPGSALAAQNTPASIASGTTLRLRQLIKQSTLSTAIGSPSFKLQYASRSGTCDTSFTGETYTDVPTTNTLTNSSAYAGTATATGGGLTWSSPSNATVSDDAWSEASSPSGTATTQTLSLTNFGLSVPTGATITGVTASIEGFSNDTGFDDFTTVQLIKAGAVSGTNLAPGVLFSPYVDSINTFGSSSTMWGLSLTPSDVNASNFGLAIQLSLDIGEQADIDSVNLKIDYSIPSTGMQYKDNAGVSNAVSAVSTANDPTDTGSVVLENYVESNNFTAGATIATGNSGLWDFAIDTSAQMAGTYCFRVVNSDGSTLSSYTQIPELTITSAGPTLDQKLRGGQSVVNGTKYGATF